MPPLENPENFLQAEELFNMANVQKATEKPAYDDINVSEEENTDPQNVDISEDDDSQNNSLPTPPLNKKLKRISRAVTKTYSYFYAKTESQPKYVLRTLKLKTP